MHFEKYKVNFCSETEATTLTPLTVKLEEKKTSRALGWSITASGTVG